MKQDTTGRYSFRLIQGLLNENLLSVFWLLPADIGGLLFGSFKLHTPFSAWCLTLVNQIIPQIGLVKPLSVSNIRLCHYLAYRVRSFGFLIIELRRVP
jgi:hypothetical protein